MSSQYSLSNGSPQWGFVNMANVNIPTPGLVTNLEDTGPSSSHNITVSMPTNEELSKAYSLPSAFALDAEGRLKDFTEQLNNMSLASALNFQNKVNGVVSNFDKAVADRMPYSSIDANNPLNIRHSSGKGFNHYSSLEEGFRDARRLLGVYNTKHGLTTPRQFIYRWAPYGDGANNPELYTQHVGEWTGLNMDAPIDINNDEDMAKLIWGMSKQENSRANYNYDDVLRMTRRL